MLFTQTTKRVAAKSLSAGLCLATLSLLSLAAAQADVQRPNPSAFYVSKSGNNQDGKSYATAWNELSQVQFSKMPPGSTLIIDGGTSGMTYRTALVDDVQTGNSASSIVIEQSRDPGHNGPVTIQGYLLMASSQPGNSGGSNFEPGGGTPSPPLSVPAAAIYLHGVSNVKISGGGKSTNPRTIGGIEVRNWHAGGIRISNTTNCSLSNIEVDNNFNQAGVLLTGNRTLSLTSMLIHDNLWPEFGGPIIPVYRNIPGTPNLIANQNVQLSICNSWIYNSRPTQYMQNGIANIPGTIQLSGGSNIFSLCAIGPYVDTNFNGSSFAVFKETLFLQPNSNLLKLQTTDNNVSLQHCTSFIPAGPDSGGISPAFINVVPGNNVGIGGSIVYGGAIEAPAGTRLDSGIGGPDYQFVTSGYTQALGSHVYKPRPQPFISDVSTITNQANTAAMYQSVNFGRNQASPAPIGDYWALRTINNLLPGVR